MPEQVTLEFPDGAFSAIQLSPTEFAEALKRAAVCKWYELGMVSQAKAAELLGVSLSKVQQSSDWAAETLTPEQIEYAASDVLYLHRLRDALLARLMRENRVAEAEACFRFLPARAKLDLLGWGEEDIFAHS